MTSSFLELYLAPNLTSFPFQSRGVSTYPQKNFTANISTPKDGSRFTLNSLTNRSHPGEFKNPSRPIFLVMCNIKLVDECWTLNVSYNTPSSWMIIIWYEGRPRQFSHLKHFRYLEDHSVVIP